MLNFFKDITCFVFDVDGVLTNGQLLILPDGLMARAMHIKDGYALQLAIKKGYRVIIISGGNAPDVKNRLEKLGIIEVWMQVSNKTDILEKCMQESQLAKTSVLYMGDDMPDLKAMQVVGLPCCPSDAVQEIKEKAIYISHLKGGEGCVRDVIEKVMKLRGDWGENTTVRAQ